MRPLRTAKDDQPGPTGRRQSATGGDAVQSVLIRTPVTMSSRWGPRKPGQSGPVSVSAGAGPGTTGLVADPATKRFSGEAAGAGGADSLAGRATGDSTGVSAGRTGGGTTGVLADCSTSRSSRVFDHRQCRSLWKVLAVKPPVRMHAHAPQASRMVATDRNAAGPVREAAGGHGPEDERESKECEREDGE